MANPMFCTIAALKTPMYLNIDDTKPAGTNQTDQQWAAVVAMRDADLTDLIEQTTDQFISEINDESLDIAHPTPKLARACLMQCCYYYRRRNELGLQSVNFKDANISTYQTGEFLKEVEGILERLKRIAMA
jgi:hypothetical protein